MRHLRIDIGKLKPPEKTAQGFLKVEGYASRVGVFEYLRKDGSVRRELRLPEEVFKAKALKGYEGAPLTNNHPAKKVTSKTAKAVSVGHVQGYARRDGDHVAVTTMIMDESAINDVQTRGKRGLSAGYHVDLDETPGTHPVYGEYDAIQRNLEINHLAIVDFPRAGDTARLRMDAQERRESMMREMRMDSFDRDDAVMLAGDDVSFTDAVNGHQHSISRKSYGGDIRVQGTTSGGRSEGSDTDHYHEWFLNDDTTITVLENDGHTHDVIQAVDLGAATDATVSAVAAADLKQDGLTPGKTKARMPTPQTKKEEKNDGKPVVGVKPVPKPVDPRDTDQNVLAQAANEIEIARARADSAEKKLAAEKARADAAEGTVAGLRVRLAEAEEDRTDSAVIEAKDLKIRELEEQVEELTSRADAAEDPKRFGKAVSDRVKLLKAAAPLIGEERLDDLDDKAIMVAALEKVGRHDVADKGIEYIRGVFEEVVGRHKKTQRSIDKLRDAATPAERNDSAKTPHQRYVERQAQAGKPANTATKGA